MNYRIESLISLIDLDTKGVYDVGSDHGYLLLDLRKKSDSMNLKGVENKKGPFLNLKQNTLGKNIEISLSDGLDEYDPELYPTVVLAGLGYFTIKKIILNNLEKAKKAETFIVDSHNKLPLIRSFFVELGYKITSEIILKDKDIFYELIKFERGNANYTEEELEFGPILLKNKNDVFFEKYNSEKENLIAILSELDKNKLYNVEYKKRLDLIEKVLKDEY